MKPLLHVALFALAAMTASSPAQAFIHEAPSHTHHGKGCFVTTSPTHHTKGIRHWRSPCPHPERKNLNPYHPGYHRPHHPHPAPH